MKIKVAIFPDKGFNLCSDWIMEKASKYKNENFRVALAKSLSELEVNAKENDNYIEHIHKLKNKKVNYIKSEIDLNTILLLDEWRDIPFRVTIVDVDTSKPWRINNDNDEESIEHFKGFDFIDERINMCKW